MSAMQTLDNIDRIDPPSERAFVSDYLRPRRPVIIRGLQDDQPIRSVSTAREAERLWGRIGLRLVPDYFAWARRHGALGVGVEGQACTMGEYLRLSRSDPRRELRCCEQLTPPEIT